MVVAPPTRSEGRSVSDESAAGRWNEEAAGSGATVDTMPGSLFW
jgi:predicted secreted protein